MRTITANWVLLSIYALVAAAVFIAALILPGFRSLAYAPVRELVMPPPEPIVLSVLYSTEKEAWLDEAAQQFQANPPRVNGRPIQLELDKTGSRQMYLAVLDGEVQPDVISPASSLQISILEELSRSKYGRALVDPADPRSCRPVVETPLVLVAWRDRATELWGDNPRGDLWRKLHDALVDPQGWATYGHPEWSYIKFGHTDPTLSNSGFMTILLMTYNYHGKTQGLSEADILSNTAFQGWLKDFEDAVTDFGDSTGTYMRDIVAFGPSKYDIVAVYEATAIEHMENARGRYGELFVYYPPATVVSDHPFCILNADWVSPEKRQAAQLFIDYLTSRPAQEAALLKYGFRPVDAGIPLDQPGSPLVRYAANGLQVILPPEIELPSGSVLDTLLTFWIRNIQR
jgi:ABC-type Fe3+ transport system substrate-binding protein